MSLARPATLHRLLGAGWLALAAALLTVQLAWAQPIVHTVQPGENLFRIGLRYGVTVEALMRANGLTTIYISVGQQLVIPGTVAEAPAPTPSPAAVTPAPAPVTATAAAPGAPVYHTVQPGETLYRIGLQYNLPWTKIQVANNLPNERVYAGQVLLIPLADTAAPAPTPTATPEATVAPTEATAAPVATEATAAPTEAPAAPTEAASNAPIVHTVQAGETLFTIGLRYGLRWTTIMAVNNLGSEYIYVGQQLVIPTDPEEIANAAPPAPAPIEKAPVPGYAGKYFLVDLSEQRVYAFEGQTLVRWTIVSTGRWPTPTVLGTYKIYAKYVSTRMVGPGYDLPNVPYTMYFYQGYGLHGTYWHNNFGTPMSHGCVNMPTSEAEWAFNWAPMGTTVIVQN